MYRVTIYNDSTGTVIHEPTVSPGDPHLYTGTLTQGSSGEIDSLQFDILPNNPGYDLLASRITMVQVLDTTTGEAIFTGRVLTITPQMEESGLVFKSVVCEDRLGYLCDSIQPYTPEATYTLEDFFTLLLENHNAQVEDYKKIYPGYVSMTTISGNVTKGLNYQTTWECIKSKLLDSVGGEIQLYTGADGLLYLDYVDELGSTGTPTIALGKNMKSVSREIDPTSVITRLIPLGAKAEAAEDDTDVDIEARLTIADVNDGVIYLDDEDAQAVYGIVEGVVEWEDVTEASNLLTKAQAWLEAQTVIDQITLTAVDLYLAGIEAEAIERYNYYLVTHEGLGLNGYYRVVKVTRNICNPTEITYGMGGQSKSLASTLTSTSNTASNAVANATAAVNAQLSKTVAALIVSDATITSLTARVATIEEAYIDEATVNTLLAGYIKTDELEATVATFGYVTADSAVITDLTAEVASINSLLAGNIGTGTVQTVHLTADNVVIDDAIITDAMIVDLTASKLTSGTIYTSLVKIASDSGENLLIDGSTIQIQDDNSTVRVQIGEDASGDYNLYLWDASGNLLWDAGGLYAAGIHDGIIKDIAVAEDAAISGTKLDISSVASELNADGSLTVDYARVTINDSTLSAWYATVNTKTDELTETTETLQSQLEVVQGQITAKVWQSDITEAISDLSIGGRNYVLNSGGYTEGGDTSYWVVSATAVTTNWSVTQYDGYTRWLCNTAESGTTVRIIYLPLSDDFDSTVDHIVTVRMRLSTAVAIYFYGRHLSSTSSTGYGYRTINTSFTASSFTADEWVDVTFTWEGQSSYEDKYFGIGLTYLKTAAGNYLDIAHIKIEEGTVATDWTPAPEDASTTLTTLQDQYASVTVTLNSITDEVADLTTTVDDYYSTLSSKVSTLEETANSITATVSDNYTTLSAADPKYGTCGTAAGTAAKVVTCSSFTTLAAGATICVYFTYANTATSPTLNVNSTGAKSIYAYGAAIDADSDYNWVAKSYVTFVYNGSQWCMVDAGSHSKIASLQITADGITSTVSDIQKSLVYYVNRNYALMSGDYEEGNDPAWYLSSTAAASYYTITVEDGYTRIYCDTTTSTTYYVYLDLSEDFDSSVAYTISFKVRLSYAAALSLRIYYTSGTTTTATNGQLTSFSSSNFSSGEWVTLSYTFTPTSTYTYKRVGFGLTNIKTAGRYLDIEYIMVEQGDTAHDWEPAPEDENPNSLSYAVTSHTSTITQLANSISLCVTTDEDTGYLRLGTGDDGTVKFTIEAANLTLDEDGNLAMTGNLVVADTITMSTDSACITGPSRIYFDTIIYAEKGAVVPNGTGVGYYGKLTDGTTNTRMLAISTSNIITLGNDDYATRVAGSAITLDANVTGSGTGYFSGLVYTAGWSVPRILHGSVSVTISASTATTFSVTFSSTFPGTPDVVLTPRHNSTVSVAPVCKLTAVSTTGFSGLLYDTSARTYVVHWVAMY